METKTCALCKILKEVSFFSKKNKGLQPYCKPCQSVKMKEWYKAHPQQQRKNVNEGKRRVRQTLRELKDGKPCTDCKVSYPYYVLQWDHVDSSNKLSTVSQLAGNGLLKQAKEEISKCELVCANCHAVRTHNRLFMGL